MTTVPLKNIKIYLIISIHPFVMLLNELSMLKRRFRILTLMSSYFPTQQRYFIIAYCTIHNFIRIVMPDYDFANYRKLVDFLDMNEKQNNSEQSNDPDMSSASAQAMAATREAIALPIWVHSIEQLGNL